MTTIDWLSGRDSSVAGGSISSIGNALSLWTILPYHSPHLYNIFYMNKFLIILIYTILTSLLHMSNCIRIRPRFRNHAANVERWYVSICFTHEYLFIYFSSNYATVHEFILFDQQSLSTVFSTKNIVWQQRCHCYKSVLFFMKNLKHRNCVHLLMTVQFFS